MDTRFAFENSSVTLLHTNMVNHEFVMAYNRGWGLRLVRKDNLAVDGGSLPYYVYDDRRTGLTHVVIAASLARRSGASSVPNGCPFDRYDKLLLVRGRDTWDFQQQLYDSFVEPAPEPDATEPLLVEDWRGRRAFYDGIFAIDTFCFASSRGFASSLLPAGGNVPRVTQRFLKNLEKFLSLTFEEINEINSQLPTDH